MKHLALVALFALLLTAVGCEDSRAKERKAAVEQPPAETFEEALRREGYVFSHDLVPAGPGSAYIVLDEQVWFLNGAEARRVTDAAQDEESPR